eukprot:scaffold5280_cov90-Skeletonema_dohrnii-CCMP3373.AAC.8
MRPSFILRNNVPSSASAELARTNGRMVHKLWNNAPFSLTGSSSLGIEPKEKYPDALLAALRHKT